MKKHILALVLAGLLACMACAGALADEAVPNSKVIEESNTYDYGTVKLTVERRCWAYNRTEMRFFLAHVYVDNPAQLQTAFAGETYSKNAVEATSDIAARHGAVLAINGDYYNYKDNYGMVIRNGALYRDKPSTRDQLLVMQDGTFVGLRPEDYTEGMGETYIEQGVVQCMAFGPLLVDEGAVTQLPEKYIISTEETIREPRTAIGQVDAGHYVVLVADGRREGWSDLGMSLREMQQVFVEEGCRIAYNLDGGGSATLVVNGERLNKTSGSRERNVSDIVYFTK